VWQVTLRGMSWQEQGSKSTNHVRPPEWREIRWGILHMKTKHNPVALRLQPGRFFRGFRAFLGPAPRKRRNRRSAVLASNFPISRQTRQLRLSALVTYFQK